MSVDINKTTFTAEEAEELERMGYAMAEVTACGDSECKWVIAATSQPSWYVLDDTAPTVDMSIALPDGVYTVPPGNKENKEPSW